MNNKPIGVFDSGYGGLTILNQIRAQMPEYDYLYLGDNARTPYGTRSFEVVYEFTLQAVEKLFEMGCHLVILAPNHRSFRNTLYRLVGFGSFAVLNGIRSIVLSFQQFDNA